MKEINNDFWVKCINDGYLNFTYGKVYQIKNGCIETDNGTIFSGYDNINELNKYNDAQFIILEQK